MEIDPFPAADFDAWASSYDQNVLDESRFPFWGYRQALQMTLDLAAVQAGMSVLDVGVGTGNLAALFAASGCRLWGVDFSPAMLAEAQRKLPQARYVLADLRQGWPPDLPAAFDRIVSAYVFHHFDTPQKVRLCVELTAHLTLQGKLVIADVAFPNRDELARVRQVAGSAWEEEFYWLADETASAFCHSGLEVAFTPVSACAGAFTIERRP